MPNDVTNLGIDQLRDIVEPPAVSWWPLAPGWYVLGISLLLGCGFFLWRLWQIKQRNAYRVEALLQLEQSTSVAEIADVMKRSALHAYPREEVASLSGSAWCNWLEQTGNLSISSQERGDLLAGVFQSPADSSLESVKRLAMKWVRQHEGSSSRKEKA